MTIDLFAKSNGVVVKVGDVSHPDAVEVLALYPDWAERNERLLRQVCPSDVQKQGRADYVF
ncbi:hypothetical protein DRO69_08125 [Candidatus Bathyarchaeota archaeon]|nr:MAG: hypothetical protein DRO69_08125 [Candidatus Bathyarchaeota archaeon]